MSENSENDSKILSLEYKEFKSPVGTISLARERSKRNFKKLKKEVKLNTKSTIEEDLGMLPSFGFLEFGEVDAFYFESVALLEEMQEILKLLNQNYLSEFKGDEVLFLEKLEDWLKGDLQEIMLENDELDKKNFKLLKTLSEFSQNQKTVTGNGIFIEINRIKDLMSLEWKKKYLTDGKVIPIEFAKK